MLEEAALEELAQDPFHHRPQGPMLPDEAGGPDLQQLLEVLLDQPEEWRLPRPPRLVDPTGDLHAQPEAGGRGTGGKRRRARLLGSRQEDRLTFKKGGAALVDVPGRLAGGGQLAWFLPPKVLRKV
ncbi:MAG TPA: hypothetical protein VGB87_04955 [Vicinamibacteria bacterium]